MCIPTKNRAKMVEEVLTFEVEYYRRYNIQLCYYDSSEDDTTSNVIKAVNEKYSLDIIYKKSNLDLCLDYKLIEILKDFEHMEYAYLWLINDSISIKEEMLKEINSLIDKEYDLIRLPLAGAGDIEDIVSEDPNEWFFNCSQGMAHMASTLMNRSLLTKANHDWDLLREKYVGNNSLDDNHGYFFMVAFYLEQISKLKNFKGVFIGNRVKWRRDSPLKREQVYWRNYVFPTWAKSYPETILKLPNIYTNKEEVIRKSDNILPGRFSKSMLIHYRLRNLYGIDIYKKYVKYFKYVTDESLKSCFFVAITPRFFLKRKYPYLISVEENWQINIDAMEKKIKKRDILIYGAGLYGEKVIGKLINDGYKGQIIGIAVTNAKGNIREIEGIRVYEIDFYTRMRKSAFVIICALPAASIQIKTELKKRKFKHYKSLFGV